MDAGERINATDWRGPCSTIASNNTKKKGAAERLLVNPESPLIMYGTERGSLLQKLERQHVQADAQCFFH